jgi:hypothetical protein
MKHIKTITKNCSNKNFEMDKNDYALSCKSSITLGTNFNEEHKSKTVQN